MYTGCFFIIYLFQALITSAKIDGFERSWSQNVPPELPFDAQGQYFLSNFRNIFVKLTDFKHALWLIIWVYFVVISDNFLYKVSISNITGFFGVNTHLFLFSSHFSV